MRSDVTCEKRRTVTLIFAKSNVTLIKVNHGLITKSSIPLRRDLVYRLKKIQNMPENIRLYHEARRRVKRLISQEKRTYEENIATNCKTNPQAFFNYINNKEVIRTGIKPLTD